MLERRRAVRRGFLGFCVLSCCLVFILGRDFFPSVDGGQIRLHMRLPTGTRIEETARVADQVESVIRTIVPAAELGTVLDNLGVAVSGINKTYSNAGTFGSHDGEIQVSLNEGHRPTQRYVEEMRRELPRRFPGVEFFFQPADMVTQILNFGLPSAIDVKVTGADLRADYDIAAKLMKQMEMIPGTVDTHIHQRLDLPTLALNMDRTQLQQLGLNPNDVTIRSLGIDCGHFADLAGLLVEPFERSRVQLDRAVAAVFDRQSGRAAAHARPRGERHDGHRPAAAEQSRRRRACRAGGRRFALTTWRRPSIYLPARKAATWAAFPSISGVWWRELRPHLPRGVSVEIRGQTETMKSSFIELGVGLVMAVVMVYLLIVVNFQSWVDAFIIITALPAALAGICWMLLLTGTTLSVPALTGAIMTMGVATANSILVVSFARQRMGEGLGPVKAALDAGATRIRPVLMTALAMIIGMIPMALGMGEGAEQNAPLGRAVIGGLLFATVSTLFFVPVIFAGVHRRLELRRERRLSAVPIAEGTR